MKHDEFVSELQHRIEAPSRGQTLHTIHAVLETLGERLQEGEAEDLAGPLPVEIDRFLIDAESGQQFDWDEFVDRVAEREDADRADAAFHTQAVMAMLDEAVPEGAMEDVRANLPPEYGDLFELVDQEEAFA